MHDDFSQLILKSIEIFVLIDQELKFYTMIVDRDEVFLININETFVRKI